ncbi:septal ring factor EnvC (AmiA/AmiB activator) [Elusimicrobium posterum]|uniref:murein hydrolase activator EnvC family protein n=1 Tax=Elusimicrobium posterum TaxID=3116653 RepID=UPI003C74024E
MEKILKSLTLCFIMLLGAGAVYADPSQSELAALQDKAKAKEEELKRIKEEEKKISKEMSALERKQHQTQQLINKIEHDITLVEQNRITTANKKDALERTLPVWQDNLEGEVELVILNTLQNNSYFESDALLEDILLDRALTHKSSFAVELKKENKVAQDKIEVFEERNKKLQEQTNKIEVQRSVLTKDFQKMKVSLTDAQARIRAAEKERDELNRSAREVMNLLAAAENKRKKEEEKQAAAAVAKGQAQDKATATAEIDAGVKSLPRPVSGEVLTKFGKEYNKDLNTWIFRDGIKIAAKKDETVYSISEGTIIYSGEFRSYGNVVIIDHGKGFFSIYGFLKEINVANGASVGARTPIGVAGTDTQKGSMGTGRIALYFEIRKGTTAVDPEIYIK